MTKGENFDIGGEIWESKGSIKILSTQVGERYDKERDQLKFWAHK